MATPRQFAQALCVALGVPVSDNNVSSIVAWEDSEGGHWHNKAYFNPLNTTWKMPGSSSATSIGVQAYVNWEEGLSATAKTLKNGYYGAILAALARSAPPKEFLQAVDSTVWGTHFTPTQLAFFSNPAEIARFADTPDPHPDGGPLPSVAASSPAVLFLAAAAGLYAYSKGWFG